MTLIFFSLIFSGIVTVCIGNNEVVTVPQLSCNAMNSECGANREGTPSDRPFGSYVFFFPFFQPMNARKKIILSQKIHMQICIFTYCLCITHFCEFTSCLLELFNKLTKRSNHIPIFTTIDRINEAAILVLIFLNQNSCGDITLQVIIVA